MKRAAFVLCGALAREVMDIARRREWDVAFYGVDAQAHMQPERIAPLVERKLCELIPHFERIIVVYGDCGTGGVLDEVLRRYNVPRIAGPHCYEMYGGATFNALMDEEPGTFFLTDFLLRGFDGLVWKGLGLDRYPILKDTYFANYKRLVYLAQRDDGALVEKAREVADRLGLPLEVRHTAYGELETRLAGLMSEIDQERYQPVMSHESGVTARVTRDLSFDTRHYHGNLSDPVLARHPSASARERRRQRTRERATSATISGSN